MLYCKKQHKQHHNLSRCSGRTTNLTLHWHQLLPHHQWNTKFCQLQPCLYMTIQVTNISYMFIAKAPQPVHYFYLESILQLKGCWPNTTLHMPLPPLKCFMAPHYLQEVSSLSHYTSTVPWALDNAETSDGSSSLGFFIPLICWPWSVPHWPYYETASSSDFAIKHSSQQPFRGNIAQ